MGVPASFILRTQMRLVNGFLCVASPQILARIPRIPLSKMEVKERLRNRYELDERYGLLLLASQGSISCTLFSEWSLSRAVIKSALQDLFYSRRMQVALASILTGTRFKFYDTLIGGGNIRVPTVCSVCGGCDSPAHLIMHAGNPPIPSTPEEAVAFLVQLATTANTINPHISAPYGMET